MELSRQALIWRELCSEIALLMLTLTLVGLIGNVQATIDITGATGEYISDSFSYSPDKVGYFFVNESNWKDNIWFSFDSSTVYYTIKIPLVNVGSYSVPIYYKKAFNDTSCNNNTGCYVESIEYVEEFNIDVTEIPQEMKEVPLPNNGLIPNMETIISSGGFQFSPQIGVASVVINTDNCKTTGISINYGDSSNISCGKDDKCILDIKAEYPFTDTSGNNYVKMKLNTNCYTYTYSLSGDIGDTTSGKTGKCSEIDIQVIGNAIRGQSLTIMTKNKNNGKSIKANIILTDSSPYTEDQLFVTNTPWDGVGKAYIDNAAEGPVSILARNEELDCEGQYIINTLSGELILPNETEKQEEDMTTLEIRDLPEEVYKNTCFTGMAYADGSLITSDDISDDFIKIKPPEREGFTSKTRVNESGQFSVCVGRKTGDWVIKASANGYKDSDEYIVTAREPREKVYILAKLSNDVYYVPPEHLGPITSGTPIMIVLSDENNFTVEEDVDIEVEFSGQRDRLGITKGYGMYTPPKDRIGEIVFRIPKTDKFEQWKSGPIMVVRGGFVGMEGIMILIAEVGVGIFIAFILIYIYVRIKRRGGGKLLDETGGGAFDLEQ